MQLKEVRVQLSVSALLGKDLTQVSDELRVAKAQLKAPRETQQVTMRTGTRESVVSGMVGVG